jgi:glycosyltransferase involved in cell wall biosynthesis/SAM-dependent methyltransferase
VVLLLNNPFLADSRSWKLATSLSAAGCRVTVVARTAPGSPQRESPEGFEVLRLDQPTLFPWLPSPRLPSGEAPAGGGLRSRAADTLGRAVQAVRYLLLARHWADRIAGVVPAADIWQAEGLVTLPVALRLRAKLGGRVVYDSRDVHVESARFARLPGPWRRLLARTERRWARAADAVVTVSEPYAGLLRQMLGVEPVIVMNGPLPWAPPDPPERRFHVGLGLPPDTRVVLHLGAIQPHRGIEELIAAMASVRRAALVVVGDGPRKAACEALAAGQLHADRIHFLPAAPPHDLLPLNASADVHAIPVKPSTVNHRYNTPTKLFDAMGAGTPVVASDLPGMAPIVRDVGFGVLCDPSSPDDIARAIREVLDAPPARLAAMRGAARAAATGAYAWQLQVERLLDLYATLDERQHPRPGRRRSLIARLRSSLWRRLPAAVTESGPALRATLIRDGARLRPRRPSNDWSRTANRTLRTTVEAASALEAVRRAGLPPHGDAPKNWDFLVALDAILRRVPHDGAVLDAGSTLYSRLLPWLWLYGYRRLHGIDLTYDRPLRRGSIRYERMDLTATTFPDETFDAVTCLSVIEHGVALDAYVREMARVLRPGGVLVTSTDYWCEEVDTAGQEAYGVPIRIFTPRDIEELLALAAAAGLTPTSPVDLGCAERVVTWDRAGLRYTFLNLVLEKRR